VRDLQNSHSNFYHLEQVDRSTAYWFASHCVVTLLPYMVTEFTLGVKPIKMIESLAVGTPVVTTLNSDVAEFGTCVRTLSNAAMAKGLFAELDSGAVRDSCLAAAEPHSWENKALRVSAIIDSLQY
jgi:glycosyltransferase involved in cell wall biosynthesis